MRRQFISSVNINEFDRNVQSYTSYSDIQTWSNWEASNYYEAIKFRSWLVSNWWYCTHLPQHRNHTVNILQVFEWLRKRKTHSEYVKHQNMNAFSLRREGMIPLTIHRLRPVLCKLSHKICSFFCTCNFGNQEVIWCTFSRKNNNNN